MSKSLTLLLAKAGHALCCIIPPPFSVGEAGRVGSPGRREIGHGKLAWRAVNPLLPSKKSFHTRCVWSQK